MRLTQWLALALAFSACTSSGNEVPIGVSPGGGSGTGGNLNNGNGNGTGGGPQSLDNFWYDPSGRPPYDYLSSFSIETEQRGFTGDLTGKWSYGKGTSITNILHSDSISTIFTIDGSSDAWIYSFGADGRYASLYLTAVKTGSCQSTTTAREVGTYVFDGPGGTLTLTPALADSTSSICGAERETRDRVEGPRSYSVSSAVYRDISSPGPYNTGIVLRGECASYESSVSTPCATIKLQRADQKSTGIPCPRFLGQSCGSETCASPYQCDTSVPGGYCSAPCCPQSDCPGHGTCAQGVCLRWCFLNSADQCRDGYRCADYGDQYLGVCVPAS